MAQDIELNEQYRDVVEHQKDEALDLCGQLREELDLFCLIKLKALPGGAFLLPGHQFPRCYKNIVILKKQVPVGYY